MKSDSQKLIKFMIIPFLLAAGSIFNVASAKDAQKPAQQIKPGDDRAPINGTVIEKIDASNYTYLRLKTDKTKEEVWVAVPQIEIKKDTHVSLRKPIPMFGFESKILKRKFDRIYFGVLTEQAEALAQNKKGAHWLPGTPLNKNEKTNPHASAQAGHPAAGDQKVSFDLNQIKVTKAEGANAVTVSELFTKKSDLKTKTVVIHGKVIKYNSDILGKNWVHIADGTGTLKDKNYDLTVITKDKAKLGDIVTVTGKVTVDKKLDPYFFPIAIEDAEVKIK